MSMYRKDSALDNSSAGHLKRNVQPVYISLVGKMGEF